MAVPTKDDMYRPILELAAGSNEALSNQRVFDAMVARLSLTEEDLQDSSSSGSPRARNRTTWALFDLYKAGLLDRPSRGQHIISEKGRYYLGQHDGEITIKMVMNILPQRESNGESSVPKIESAPDEMMSDGYRTLQANLSDELLESLSEVSPDNFEQLILDLLEAMGYGEGDRVGGSGDGGIDGIINQDALGLEKVYIQAKRWQGHVGEPEIRNFSGSLDARGASKGVFVTTSSFSRTARETASIISAGSKFIRLIDGGELANLMIDHDVGVITQRTYKIKKLDENYFAPEA